MIRTSSTTEPTVVFGRLARRFTPARRRPRPPGRRRLRWRTRRRPAPASASGAGGRGILGQRLGLNVLGRLAVWLCGRGALLGRLARCVRLRRLLARLLRSLYGCVLLEHGLLCGQAVGVGRLFGLVQQTRLDRLFRARVATLAHASALADAVAQVVQLGAAHVASRGDLDALDLRRVHGEHALNADAEGLLAHGEGLARSVALALDHDPLEDLDASARPLDDLEVDLHAVARREVGNAAQLRALDGFDDAAHE